MTEAVIDEPSVCIAFGIELGENARAEGLVYDVDYDKLHDALRDGGLTDDDMLTYPTIIKKANDAECTGRFYWAPDRSPVDGRGSRIELYAQGGTSKINTRAATHEAKHLADRLYVGDSAFVSKRARLMRKIGVAVSSFALVGSYSFMLSRGYEISNASEIGGGVVAAAEGYVVMNGLLIAEYALRKQERRARRAERLTQRSNIFLLRNEDGTIVPNSNRDASLKTIARQVLVPNFSR